MSVKVLYAKQIEDFSGEVLSEDYLSEYFSEAGNMLRAMQKEGLKVGYFFIDPLMDVFESGNKFYMKVLKCGMIPKAAFYRSGAGPSHAFADALTMIGAGVFDAVAIFAYEPLQHNRIYRGREEISRAMKVLDANLFKCYNDIMQELIDDLSVSVDEYRDLTDLLYENYARSYRALYPDRNIPEDRGKFMDDAGGPLFRMTDCANPNIDYAGGVIMCNDRAAEYFPGKKPRGKVVAASHYMVSADWQHPETIVGSADNIFPHLRKCFDDLEEQAGFTMKDAYQKGELLLNAYTCYPPVPFAFLLAGGFASNAGEIREFLQKDLITLDGGLSIGRAPWNCPALRASILVADRLEEGKASYGLVQANGGIGETQGLILVGRADG